MSRILVVDDSPIDLRLVTGLLGKDPDLQIDQAADGREAMAQIAAYSPDLIVTDLIMPGISGLELVLAVAEENPQIPVVLITAHGSEEMAVEALRRGAASYVPKRLLAVELINTVHRVLGLSRERAEHLRLMEYLVGDEIEFVLENDDSLIPPLAQYLQNSLARVGICNQASKLQSGIAIEEALTNALYHGNLEVSSTLREEGGQSYVNLARKRMSEPPYKDRRIHVGARISGKAGIITIRDEGPGFKHASLPDPTKSENVTSVHGRGVFLMRTFMDDVVFNEKGNQVVLTKRGED